jgi:hypothetical protein
MWVGKKGIQNDVIMTDNPFLERRVVLQLPEAQKCTV